MAQALRRTEGRAARQVPGWHCSKLMPALQAGRAGRMGRTLRQSWHPQSRGVSVWHHPAGHPRRVQCLGQEDPPPAPAPPNDRPPPRHHQPSRRASRCRRKSPSSTSSGYAICWPASEPGWQGREVDALAWHFPVELSPGDSSSLIVAPRTDSGRQAFSSRPAAGIDRCPHADSGRAAFACRRSSGGSSPGIARAACSRHAHRTGGRLISVC